MSDYTTAMFREDHDRLVPVFNSIKSMGKLNENDPDPTPDGVLEQVLAYFIDKYGKNKGADFELRFFSVVEFIDRYQKDLLRLGLITQTDEIKAGVDNRLFELLLGSYATHNPSIIPVSPLLNREHFFNYKKVVKALGL